MNKEKSYISAERARRRIGATIGFTAMALLLLLLLGVLPLRRERQRLGRTLQGVSHDLQPYLALVREEPLSVRVERERRDLQRLRTEWEHLRARAETFPPDTRLVDVLDSPEEGRIDYKVALYDARNRLGEMARAAGVTLPDDLGLPETIGAEESAETRLWQLVVISQLLERSIGLDIPVIHAIRAYDPLLYNLTAPRSIFILLYPVRMETRQTYGQWIGLLDAMLDQEVNFTVQRFEARIADIGDDPLLNVSMICSAVLFRSGLPGEPGEEQPGEEGPEETDLLLPVLNNSGRRGE